MPFSLSAWRLHGIYRKSATILNDETRLLGFCEICVRPDTDFESCLKQWKIWAKAQSTCPLLTVYVFHVHECQLSCVYIIPVIICASRNSRGGLNPEELAGLLVGPHVSRRSMNGFHRPARISFDGTQLGLCRPFRLQLISTPIVDPTI